MIDIILVFCNIYIYVFMIDNHWKDKWNQAIPYHVLSTNVGFRFYIYSSNKREQHFHCCMINARVMNSIYYDLKLRRSITHIALQAPGTWYLKCILANQYRAWVFMLSISRANSKFSFAPCWQQEHATEMNFSFKWKKKQISIKNSIGKKRRKASVCLWRIQEKHSTRIGFIQLVSEPILWVVGWGESHSDRHSR